MPTVVDNDKFRQNVRVSKRLIVGLSTVINIQAMLIPGNERINAHKDATLVLDNKVSNLGGPDIREMLQINMRDKVLGVGSEQVPAVIEVDIKVRGATTSVGEVDGLQGA